MGSSKRRKGEKLTGPASSRVRRSAAWSDWSLTGFASRMPRKVLAKATSAVIVVVVTVIERKSQRE